MDRYTYLSRSKYCLFSIKWPQTFWSMILVMIFWANSQQKKKKKNSRHVSEIIFPKTHRRNMRPLYLKTSFSQCWLKKYWSSKSFSAIVSGTIYGWGALEKESVSWNPRCHVISVQLTIILLCRCRFKYLVLGRDDYCILCGGHLLHTSGGKLSSFYGLQLLCTTH